MVDAICVGATWELGGGTNANEANEANEAVPSDEIELRSQSVVPSSFHVPPWSLGQSVRASVSEDSNGGWKPFGSSCSY
jgi:hypothetical protein